MKKTIFFITGMVILSFYSQAQTVTDIDGNVYHTVTIGTQVWMVENLKVTHYRNGDSIPNEPHHIEWCNLSTGAYCNYNNDEVYVDTYGRLYNWYAVKDSRNIAPDGWHIPTDAEWTTLADFLGGNSIAGGKLKEAGTTHWQSPNTGATNESGFLALPGGYRNRIWDVYSYAKFVHIEEYAAFWSYTYNFPGSADAWIRWLSCYGENISRTWNNAYGFSVRCICDFAAQTDEIENKIEIEIYPNPANEKLFVNNFEEEGIILTIYNIVGECVLIRELSKERNEIGIGSLSKGIYVIKVSGSAWTVQRKLLKE